jgi:hypothetical protein
MPVRESGAKLARPSRERALLSLMPHRITRRDVDQFRITLFLLENGQQVPVKLLQRYLDLAWLEPDPREPGKYTITAEGIRRRHFE